MNHTACSMSEDPMSAPILTSTFAYLGNNNTFGFKKIKFIQEVRGIPYLAETCPDS